MADEPSASGASLEGEAAQRFFARADRFLAAANALLDEAEPGQVSAPMLYATARFCAFVAQKQGLPAGEAPEETVAYFVGEYEAALRENLRQVLVARQG